MFAIPRVLLVFMQPQVPGTDILVDRFTLNEFIADEDSLRRTARDAQHLQR